MVVIPGRYSLKSSKLRAVSGLEENKVRLLDNDNMSHAFTYPTTQKDMNVSANFQTVC